jgi:hypothetical protein
MVAKGLPTAWAACRPIGRPPWRRTIDAALGVSDNLVLQAMNLHGSLLT